ncbi:hypothetical protein BV210_10185 [Halorientalis sp. IM1011]|uniref:S8 family serine peptidase n=1 Tax=Halorientalis sp. IM1011 TaxID=1932360 RepID=UPI00097CD5D3|nr:S8 family serine peptidase [Halorientalis sp. IM1011]AQL43058.1 hypothetical protein BV210_10185 [Halorientalis sp. IM1011]
MSDRRVVLIAAVGVLALTAGIGLFALQEGGSADRRVADERFARAHAAGYTGAGVSVGIVDVTGFDADATGVADQVVATRAFGGGESVTSGGEDEHGTAAARVVARAVPGANLSLATADSPSGYRAAVEWLLDRDVDVIVAPVGFYGKPGDGTAAVERLATRAARQGVVFVAPAGNTAESHWVGRYDEVRNGRLVFGDRTRNFLQNGGRRVSLWLSRTEAGPEGVIANYTLALYRLDESGSELVARSQPYRHDDAPNERIDVTVPEGTYFVTVEGPAEPTGERLELVSQTHELQRARGGGSLVAPGTARGVLTVGAFDRERGRVRPYSSRGPTADGRIGIDVVAPDTGVADVPDGFTGSSAAVPYAGATAALVRAANPDLGPAAVEGVLERTATEVDGSPFAAGDGRVDPWAAVQAARNASG